MAGVARACADPTCCVGFARFRQFANRCSILASGDSAIVANPAAVLELADRADSNSAVREDVWVQVPPAVPNRPTCVATPPDGAGYVNPDGLGPDYVYLLGLYLADGNLSHAHRGVWKIRTNLDSRYPGIIARCKASIRQVTGRPAGHLNRQGCLEIYNYGKHWPCLFPQHGAGPKHLRPITLAAWQLRLVDVHAGEFMAGLIHSDGCRCLNRVQGYVYPRHFFSNESPDIRALFVTTCERLGVRRRPAGRRNISVARRGSVAILDRLVGPKT